MTSDEVIGALQRRAATATASEVAGVLAEVAPEGLTQFSLVSYFKRAFPRIPLRTLLDAGAWNRVSQGGLDDHGFDELLLPWLPTSPDRRS